jgi:hypothetical protein
MKEFGIWTIGVQNKRNWVHYDGSLYNDYILVHYSPSKPFTVNKKKVFHAAIV